MRLFFFSNDPFMRLHKMLKGHNPTHPSNNTQSISKQAISNPICAALLRLTSTATFFMMGLVYVMLGVISSSSSFRQSFLLCHRALLRLIMCHRVPLYRLLAK
jgi:hypothetical protein